LIIPPLTGFRTMCLAHIQLCASSSAKFPLHDENLKQLATESGPTQRASEVASCVFH